MFGSSVDASRVASVVIKHARLAVGVANSASSPSLPPSRRFAMPGVGRMVEGGHEAGVRGDYMDNRDQTAVYKSSRKRALSMKLSWINRDGQAGWLHDARSLADKGRLIWMVAPDGHLKAHPSRPGRLSPRWGSGHVLPSTTSSSDRVALLTSTCLAGVAGQPCDWALLSSFEAPARWF